MSTDQTPETSSDVLAGLNDPIHISHPDCAGFHEPLDATAMIHFDHVHESYRPPRIRAMRLGFGHALDLCGHPMPCWVEGCLRPEGARSLSEKEVMDLIYWPQESEDAAPSGSGEASTEPEPHPPVVYEQVAVLRRKDGPRLRVIEEDGEALIVLDEGTGGHMPDVLHPGRLLTVTDDKRRDLAWSLLAEAVRAMEAGR